MDNHKHYLTSHHIQKLASPQWKHTLILIIIQMKKKYMLMARTPGSAVLINPISNVIL